MNQQDRREACLRMLALNLPYREISRTLKMSPSTISAIARGEDALGITKVGRPTKITKDMRRFLDVSWQLDATIPDQGMADRLNAHFGTNVSASTICRVRNEMKYLYRPAKVRQELTPVQKSIRLQFCDWVLRHAHELSNLVFSDESRFERGPDNKWRRIKRGCWSDSCFIEKRKFPTGVMVWGAIGEGFRSRLMRCSKGVGTSEYTEIVAESGLISGLNGLHGPGMWTFQQDGAPAHTSAGAWRFFDAERIRVLPGWPPNSPDLNPIEMLWGVMKRQVRMAPSGQDMFESLRQTWEAIPRETTDKLVASFFDRCRMVLSLNGESAGPWLSSGRCPPVMNPELRNWTEAEDRQLIDLVESQGRHWKVLANATGVDPLLLKHRYRLLVEALRNLRISNDSSPPDIRFFLAPDLHASLSAMTLDEFLDMLPARENLPLQGIAK